MLKAADTDGSGSLNVREVYAVVKSAVGLRRQGHMLRKLLGILSILIFCLFLAIGVMTAALLEAYKDTEANGAMLTTRGGTVMQTTAAEYPLPLIVAPVLEQAQLAKISSLTVSYIDTSYMSVEAVDAMINCINLDDATPHVSCDVEPPRARLSARVESVLKVNTTAAIFSLASTVASEVRVWNGDATVILADGTLRDLCESDVSCSALTVSDESNATELVHAAEAALVQAGFDAESARRHLHTTRNPFHNLAHCMSNLGSSSSSTSSWSSSSGNYDCRSSPRATRSVGQSCGSGVLPRWCAGSLCCDMDSNTCVEITCPAINVAASGTTAGAVCDGGAASTSPTCTFECEDGYTLSGSSQISCTSDGAWDSHPTCTLPQPPASPPPPATPPLYCAEGEHVVSDGLTESCAPDFTVDEIAACCSCTVAYLGFGGQCTGSCRYIMQNTEACGFTENDMTACCACTNLYAFDHCGGSYHQVCAPIAQSGCVAGLN